MLYTVGDRIDLTHLNSPQQQAERQVAKRVIDRHDRYVDGTKISFLKMAKNLIVLDIVEPPIALHVAVGV